jgi:glutamate 2,3-aminomutase
VPVCNRIQAFYIAGTHWDREWYEPFQEYRMWLVQTIDHILDLLDEDPEYRVFHLDGQAVMLEDYLEIRPEQRIRLLKRLEEGKLIAGPWYCQPDELLISGESFIRNLSLGIRMIQGLGIEPMREGYCPDMFGHISSLPVIFAGFDFKHVVLWRGASEKKYGSQFVWEGTDGESEIIVTKLPDDGGYSAFLLSVRKDDPLSKDLEKLFQSYLETQEKYLTTPLLYLSDANDHKMAVPETTQMLERLKKAFPDVDIKHACMLEYFSELEKYRDRLPSYQGELRDPTTDFDALYQFLIPHCISSRYPLKLSNDRCQNLLELWSEPLVALTRLGGMDIPSGFLEQAWKYLLKNQPHDSICGCSIDQVHSDMHFRYDQCRLLGDGIRRQAMAKLSSPTAEQRARELKTTIEDYLNIRHTIPAGLSMADEFTRNKERILRFLGATEKNWNNWKWQIENRIDTVDILAQIVDLTDDEIQAIHDIEKENRWSISPYYASLMSPSDPACPIRQQAIPSALELCSPGKTDPMAEEFTSPAAAITRRYPDRLIINVTNQCAMYCRHCQRRRNIGEIDKHTSRHALEAALEYVRQHVEIRDVLITGGDALMLSDGTLDWLLTELDNIPHVEIKRLGTRTLVTLPQRITPELCEILEKHHPLYINTQFNHSKEVTASAAKAAHMLSRAGIPLGNQAVLLKGINNNPHVMKRLNHELLQIRIRPYYIFQAKRVKGTTHFRCRVEEGIEIMENLRGYTSGLAIPTYIINAPGGFGKTPILPQYILSWAKDKVTLRTWEKRTVDYPNHGPEGNIEY